MKRNRARIVSFLMALIMVFASVPNIQAFAAQNQENAKEERSSGPFLYYSFDDMEGNTVKNLGTGGEELNAVAVANGGTAEVAPGLIGNAAKLSGNGYFQMPEGIMREVTDFTLSVWVYTTQQVANQTVCTFAIGTEQYLILTTQRGDQEQGVSLVMTDGGNPRKEERIAYTGQKEKLSMNAWHQLTFTLEGNVGTLYVDGVKAEVKSDYTTNPSKLGNTIENYIGKPTWADPYFNGYIDEFQVYDYALSEEEVYAIHDSAAQQLVQADVEALDLGDTGGVMEDLNLPSVGINGSAITWKSSNPKYLDDTGKVTRPASGEGNVTVTLTATISQGEFSGTKDFEVVILSEDFAFSQEDPYLHYTFDDREGSKIASNSGKGGRSLSASINGGTVEWTNGLFQGAAKLSSNGHFKMPDGVVKDLTDFTLSTWVYIDEQLSNQTVCTFARGTEQYLILTTQRGNMEQGVSLVMTSGEESSGDHTEKEQRISYTAQKEKLSANAWHHIAFTLEGSVGVLYVDGVKAEVKSDFTTNPSKLGYTVDNYIGRPTWPDPYLTGMVDDFRIYDYALTEEEIYEISSAADPALAKEDAEKLDLGDTSAVTQDLNLPTQGQSGSTIRWTSSNPLYLSDSGVVHRPDAGSGSVEVTLTASVSKGSAEPVTRDFVITILDMSVEKDDLNVFSMETGNPTVPAYLADASFYYDENTETFYAYGTNDGAGGGNVFPTQMWYSKDCKNWKNEIVELPKSWTDYAGTSAVWAPSIAYSPQTEKYYLMYGIDCKTFIAMSDSPMGPWEDANSKSPGNLLYVGYDGQFFVDDDGQMYITTDSGEFKIMKLAFDEEGKVLIDGSDPRFDRTGQNEFIGEYKYAQVTTIRNSFEASFIYKRDGLYYLMWSFNGSENYNVRYAVSENITGPYREINDSMDVPILQRDDDNNILGPGHHSVFDYNGRTFIAYHRQHYPFVDSKRQTCIEELIFNEDKSIQTVKPTHMGTVVAEDLQEEEKENIALGKQTKVSSAREYDNSENPNRYRTTDISFRYEGNFAVDENNGTRWEPVLGSRNPWLIVDLGSDCRIDEIETIFEFTSRTYKYKLEYLEEAAAEDLNAAGESQEWKTFADRTKEGTPKSPVTDTAPDQKPVTARYVRLVITGAVDLPPTADGADLVNAENGLSIFEIKVYGEDYADDLERIFEAESYHNVYGMEIEKTNTSGLNLFSTNNNDYILYQDVDLGDGVDTFVAKVASNIEEGRLEIHLDSLESEPVGVLNVGNTGGDQSWDVLSAALNADAKGFHEKVYLVYKGNPLTENLFQIDWFKFGEPILDKTPLRDTIAEAKDKAEGRYEKAGLELLKEALAEAIATLENPDALQAELYAAQEKLQQAIDNLQYRGGILAEYYTVPAAAEGSERGDSYDGELLEDNKKETVKEDNINYATMEDLLMQHTGQNDNAGVRWSGRLVVPETGEYTFSTYTDNGVRLYIDGQLVIDWWMNDWEQNQYSAPIHLEKGQICEFTFEFMELTGGSCAKWYWSVDGSTREIVPYDVLTLPKADYQELQDYLQKIPERKEEDYTPESWKAYEKALEQAREAVKDELAFQEDLDGAKAALEAAEKGLQEAEKEEPGENPDTPQTPETPDTSNPSQKPDESQKPGADSEAPKDEETAKVPAKGQIIRKGNVKYQVTKSKAAGGTVTVKGIVKKNVSSVKVPKTVTLNGYRFTVTKISKNAFKNCKKIKRVSIGDGVTTVEQGAFQNCTALAKITLGKNVKTIGKNAFRGDKKLKSIVMKSKKLKRVQKNALKNIHKKAVIQIPKSRKKAYAKLLSRKGSSVKLKYLR